MNRASHDDAIDEPLSTPRARARASDVQPTTAAAERPTVSELPSRPVGELDVPMVMRVLRFEVALEERAALDDPRLGAARALRSLLLRAAAYAGGEALDAASFEASVAHFLRRAYAWAFRALDAAIAAQPVRPLPRAAEEQVTDVIEACEARLCFDPLLARLRDILVDLIAAAARLSGEGAERDVASHDAP